MCQTNGGIRVDGSAEIKIKYLPGSPHLEQKEGSDWIDLYTYEDIYLPKGSFTIISLGVAMKIPDGYEAIIAPRSSTFKRWGILQTNSIGVIDNSYCGNDDIWGMPVYATFDIVIPKGTRLCQFRIQQKQPNVIFIDTDDLKTDSRGGFGSTGF